MILQEEKITTIHYTINKLIYGFVSERYSENDYRFFKFITEDMMLVFRPYLNYIYFCNGIFGIDWDKNHVEIRFNNKKVLKSKFTKSKDDSRIKRKS